MKKIPVFTSVLLVAGVLATMAFTHPLSVDNGVVRGVSSNAGANGGSFEIRNHGETMTFILRQGVTILPSGATLAVGDHVTVFADCFHSGVANRNVNQVTSASRTGGTTAASSTSNTTSNTANTAATNGMKLNGMARGTHMNGNEHACFALAVLVRKSATAASAGAVPATGGTGTPAATGSSTPAAGAAATGTPSSSTPAASASTATATPMVCPTATGTGTPAAGGSGAMSGTATATAMPCVTPTSTP